MTGPTQHISQIYIQLSDGDIDADGGYRHLEPVHMANLLSVEVDDSLYLPDMFAIHLMDPNLDALKADIFKPGTKVKISIQLENETTRTLLMKGEITSIEPDINSTERSTLTARGYDLSHKLQRTRHTVAYMNVTDSDIAQRLAQGASLRTQITPTSEVYEYLMQANQTDWEFLMERARRIGYRLFVEGKTLHFEPPPTSPAVVTKLEWGLTLQQFKARLSTMEQVSEVVVRGWDPKGKREIVGRATRPSGAMSSKRDNGRTGGDTASSAHSIPGKQMIVDTPVFTQSEADKIAQAALDRLASNFIQAEGRAAGNPTIQAASTVDIDGVGQRFSSKYMVTRALHRYNAKAYTTQFWVSGGNGTMTITDLLAPGSHSGNGTSSGVVRSEKATARGVMAGIVTNNADPENLGRVKVKIPALDTESHWCRLASTMAGPVRGIAFLPEVNDEVVVAFENGDPNHAYVLGAVWNGNDRLPKPLSRLVSGGKTIRRVMKSRLGHEIVIDDSPDPTEGIILIDKTEKNAIRIITKENKIVVEAQQDIEITSKMGKVKISGFGGVDIDGTPGQVNVKGIRINMN
jgi:phage protein D